MLRLCRGAVQIPLSTGLPLALLQSGKGMNMSQIGR